MIGEKTESMALLIQMSIGPNARSTSAAACSIAFSSATSSGRTIASPPSSSISRFAASSPSLPRAISPTFAPRFPNARAVARPTPAEAPVMTTTSGGCMPDQRARRGPAQTECLCHCCDELSPRSCSGGSRPRPADQPHGRGAVARPDARRHPVHHRHDVHAGPRPRESDRARGSPHQWLDFAIVYGLFFEHIHAATWWYGALLGGLQGIFIVPCCCRFFPASIRAWCRIFAVPSRPAPRAAGILRDELRPDHAARAARRACAYGATIGAFYSVSSLS